MNTRSPGFTVSILIILLTGLFLSLLSSFRSQQSSPSSQEQPEANVPAPTAQSQAWKSLELVADPNPVRVGNRSQLHVFGTRQDGWKEEITIPVTFTVSGNIGSIDGSSFIAEHVGAGQIEARLDNQGIIKSATIALFVNAAAHLSAIEIVPKTSPTIRSGEQVELIVKARYADGRTAIVTPQTVWTISDPTLGSIQEGIFSAWIHGRGDIVVTGSYTEDGVTTSSSVTLTLTE